jgi:hypothetical protein
MLVLRRRDGQWVEAKHRSGDVLRIRVYGIGERGADQVSIAFDDDERNFEIERPERVDSTRSVPDRKEPIKPRDLNDGPPNRSRYDSNRSARCDPDSFGSRSENGARNPRSEQSPPLRSRRSSSRANR